jgi:hypothetical protein
LHNDEATAKTLMSSFINNKAEPGDTADRNDMRALAATEDGIFPCHRALKVLVIAIVYFMVILSTLFLD